MSATLASIKSSFIAKVNHAAVRRHRSAVDTCQSDVTSGLAAADVASGRRADAPAHGGVRRRRIRSPFSSSRLWSEPKKSSRSSLAEQRIMESVVFRPSVASTSGRSAAHQFRDVGDAGRAPVEASGGRRRSADFAVGVDAGSSGRQRVAVVKRSMSQEQGHDDVGQMTLSSTFYRGSSMNNSDEPLTPFVKGNVNDLP